MGGDAVRVAYDFNGSQTYSIRPNLDYTGTHEGLPNLEITTYRDLFSSRSGLYISCKS
jgi:hypothetical protein